MKWSDILGHRKSASVDTASVEDVREKPILPGYPAEQIDHDLQIVENGSGARGDKVQKEADKQVRSAAADWLKKLRLIQYGHCPRCNEPLRRHLFASVCDSCGWHMYDTPREGPVRVHLANGKTVEGERAYVLDKGDVIVLSKDVVRARVPAPVVVWIEYLWTPEEVAQRHRQIFDLMEVRCAWCDGKSDPEKDGFHLVHVAFGSTQERYCFCCDECYEAFRKMYPARVHRNCYERNCAECELCTKRYSDEADGMRMMAKDFLKMGGKR